MDLRFDLNVFMTVRFSEGHWGYASFVFEEANKTIRAIKASFLGNFGNRVIIHN